MNNYAIALFSQYTFALENMPVETDSLPLSLFSLSNISTDKSIDLHYIFTVNVKSIDPTSG